MERKTILWPWFTTTVLCNICWWKIISLIINLIDKVFLSVLPSALPAVPCGYSVKSAWNGGASLPIITTTFLRSGTAAKTLIVVTGVSQASGLWLSLCPLFTPSSICETTCLSYWLFKDASLTMSLNAGKGSKCLQGRYMNLCLSNCWFVLK